jgi:ASC-1-like (ASCH) protein
LDVFFGTKSQLLERMIKFKTDMGLDGDYKPIKDFNYKKEPFYGIGLLEFRRRFDEIMAYYFKKKKNKADLYYHIMENKDKIFTTSVPVYSAVLRQVFFSEEDYSYTKIDRSYNALFGNVSRLNEETTIDFRNYAKICENLFRAQRNVNTAFKLIFTSLTEKEGLIRRNILGGRVNFSARTVIVPNARLRSYQIELPYVAFVEMFKEQIINLLVKLDGMSFNDAVDLWFRAYTEFNLKVYRVIEYIIKYSKGGCRTLLNR